MALYSRSVGNLFVGGFGTVDGAIPPFSPWRFRHDFSPLILIASLRFGRDVWRLAGRWLVGIGTANSSLKTMDPCDDSRAARGSDSWTRSSKVQDVYAQKGYTMRFSWLGVWVLMAALASRGSAQLLPTDEGTKWLGVFTGAANLSTGLDSEGEQSGLAPRQLTATFRLDGPLDNQGTPGLPAPYAVGTVGGADHAIPEFAADGRELIGTLRNLEFYLAWDSTNLSWVSGAALNSYAPTFGDALFFADPIHLLNGLAGQNGGQFDVLYNNSGFGFDPVHMNPANAYSGGQHFVYDASTGAFAGGSSALDALLTGSFENLLANGVTQSQNLRFAGTTLLDASISLDGFGNSLGQYAVLGLDVLGPSGPGEPLQFSLPNFLANVDLTGGSSLSAIREGGLRIQRANGSDTGNRTDFRFTALFSELFFPGWDNLSSDNLQDVAAFQGSFTFVSVPETSSLVLSGLALGGLAVLGVVRRKHFTRLALSR